MKTTKYLTLTGFLLLFFQSSFSQAICGFDAVHNKKMQEDPTYRQHVQAGEASIREYILEHPEGMPLPGSIILNKVGSAPTTLGKAGSAPTTLATPLYTIPVVVHVIHTGGPVGSIYNPTDAQILGAVNYLNAVYNGTYPGTQGAGDLQMQFALAQRDPNCNPTNGINRVDGSGIAGYVSGGVQAAQTSVGTADINVKNLIRWDPTQYYNIWVVDKIDGNDGTSGTFIAGFAYFPGSPANVDGIVMLATQMVTGQKTLPHEIGHAFNLYHPFQGSTDSTMCPPNANCNTDGDQVCDTDPISYHYSVGGGVNFTCRTGNNNPCTSSAYTINTESNYMNYTSCYTLFTAGQKARMQAAAAGVYRSSLSTSQGGTAPSAGSSPCVPKIDFELTGDQVTETTAATSGCRAYKDYTYNMVIGNSPSATATATISMSSGTATQGVDFDITTNGSFTTPGTTISFPAGSMASQPFTIRIYDDASVNGTRKAVLGFTVNNGGGNAVAGDGRPNFTMIINDNDNPPTGGTSTGTATIGASTYYINASPFDATQQRLRTQFLYKASELTTAGVPAGNLTGISLNLQKLSTRAYTNLNINIGTTTSTYLVNGSVTLGTGMTTVKTLAAYSTVNGWNNFVFSTPFTWNGTSNLVVELCYDNGTTAPGDIADNVVAYSDGGTASQGNLLWQDGVNCSQSFGSVNYYGNGVKPQIQVSYGIPATIVQTALNSSQQQYLGPNTDIYFYDQTNSQLMARIQNLSSFNYGCTQVLIDRAGTSANPFWNNNTPNYLMNKTFRVLPTTNNSSGSYNITLYYTQAEVNGWQSATGQPLSNIQLVKVAGQISAVTPANPTGGGAFVLATPTINSLGTNTGLTYNFTNGFSGFGAGVPGAALLPIGLLDFSVRLKKNNAVLDWSTSFEAGSKGFEVERSYDGNTFVSIGYIAAAGNSSIIRSYSFTDPSTAQDNNYYRLKQVDLDDQFTYSKVVLIRNPDLTTGTFTVLPNPFTNNLDILFGRVPPGRVNIRLLDVTGKELLRQSGIQSGLSRMHVDLSGKSVSPGVYLLEVGFNNEIYVQKIIRE